MLHLIKDSPFSSNSLALCLGYLNENDSIILMENAVLAAVDGQIWSKKLLQAKAAVYALEEDVNARALSSQIAPSIKSIDINGFVTLTELHESSISW